MIYLPKSEKKGFSKGVENDRNNRFQIGIPPLSIFLLLIIHYSAEYTLS